MSALFFCTSQAALPFFDELPLGIMNSENKAASCGDIATMRRYLSLEKMNASVFHNINSDSIDDFLIDDNNLLDESKLRSLITTIFNAFRKSSTTAKTPLQFVFSIGLSAPGDFLSHQGTLAEINDFLRNLEQESEPRLSS